MKIRRMKKFRAGLAVGLLGLCLAGVSQAKDKPKSITFVSWGGSTQEAQNEAWAESFTDKTDIKVVNGGPTNYGKFKAMVQSGNVEWDVVDVEGPFAYKAAEEGLLEPLDFTIIDPDDVEDRFRTDHAVGDFYYSFVLAYNADKVEGDLSDWADLFDESKYDGKITLYEYPVPGVLEMALLASGVEPSDLYPLDLDRAFEQLDKIKDRIVWWGTGAKSQQLLASGEASVGNFWNGRVYYLQKSGVSAKIIWHDNMAMADYLVVPKGAPHKKEAMEFIANAVSKEGQAKFSELTGYAPVNDKAIDLIADDFAENLSTAHTENQITLDDSYWAENQKELSDAWNEWLLK